MTRLDRTLAIVLGVVVGLAIIIAFVLFGSEGTIDSPRVDQPAHTSSAAAPPPAHRPGSDD